MFHFPDCTHQFSFHSPMRAHGWCLVTVMITVLFYGLTGLAQAQTILDYSLAQRAVLEAELAKNSAKALAVPSPVITPGLAQPAHAFSPAAKPATQQEPVSVAVNGVIVLPHRSLVEVQHAAAVYYLGTGDYVPGTTWRVMLISPDSVTLSKGQKTKGRLITRSFGVPTRALIDRLAPSALPG